jgi:hypothetical protein
MPGEARLARRPVALSSRAAGQAQGGGVASDAGLRAHPGLPRARDRSPAPRSWAGAGEGRDAPAYRSPQSFSTISSFARLCGSIGASGSRTSGLILPISPSAVFTGVGLVSMNKALCSGQSL